MILKPSPDSSLCSSGTSSSPRSMEYLKQRTKQRLLTSQPTHSVSVRPTLPFAPRHRLTVAPQCANLSSPNDSYPSLLGKLPRSSRKWTIGRDLGIRSASASVGTGIPRMIFSISSGCVSISLDCLVTDDWSRDWEETRWSRSRLCSAKSTGTDLAEFPISGASTSLSPSSIIY
jgi:hypothetical protein